MSWRERITKQGVRDASILIALFTVLSQMVGLVREAVLASLFGTSPEYDLLLLAITIPILVGSILFAALPMSSVPLLQSQADRSWNISLRNPFVATNTIIVAGVSFAAWVFMPYFTQLLAEDLSTESLQYVTTTARIFCLLIPLRAFEALFRSMLNVRNHFLLPSLAPLVFNLVAISTLITVFPMYGSFAFIAAWIIGMVAQTAMAFVPALILSRNDRNKPAPEFRHSEYLGFFGIVILIESVGLLLEPMDRFMAGIFLSAGYVSAVNYGAVIYFLPVRVAVNSVATAIFPSFARLAVSGAKEGMATMYHRTIAACIFTLIPSSILLFLHRVEIIRILLERGRFDQHSTQLTATILAWYIPATVFVAISTFQWRIFYALKAWRYFAAVRASAIALKAGFGILLIESNWAMAIGLGTAIHFAFSFVTLEYHLIARLGVGYSSEDVKLVTRAFVGAIVVTTVTALSTYSCLELLNCSGFAALAVSGGITIAVGIAIDYFWNLTSLDIKAIIARLKN